MTTRCKPGDLAIVIRSTMYPELVGKVVTCLHPYSGLCVNSGTDKPVWEVDPPIYRHAYGAMRRCVFNDDALRPIRPGDGQDETLTWAGKPATSDKPSPVPEKQAGRVDWQSAVLLAALLLLLALTALLLAVDIHRKFKCPDTTQQAPAVKPVQPLT